MEVQSTTKQIVFLSKFQNVKRLQIKLKCDASGIGYPYETDPMKHHAWLELRQDDALRLEDNVCQRMGSEPSLYTIDVAKRLMHFTHK